MTGVVHSLSASITSALAVKPSTVYVLRVENTLTRDVWHLRRCFSEFCDLREKMIALIDGNTSSSSASGSLPGSAQNSPTTGTISAMRLLSLKTSGSTPGSNSSSPRSAGCRSAAPERFPYLYAKFPRRQFFGSRTRKVIEQRTLALNQFLQEALWFMREVKTQYNIAVYFSLMTQLEVFFDCGKHASVATPPSVSTPAKAAPSAVSAKGLCPPFYISASARPAQAPVAPFPTAPLRAYSSPEIDSAAKDAANRARAVAARGFWHATRHENDESDEEADDYEERKVLKKTISCFMNHEVQERRVVNPANEFVAALQTRASERDAVVSAADAWAARIEIAGIPPVEALRRRNSNNQAMLLQQYSIPSSKDSPRRSGRGDGDSDSVLLYALHDRSKSTQIRRECRA